MDVRTKELISCLKEMIRIVKSNKPSMPFEGEIKKLTLSQFEVIGYLCEKDMARMSDIAKESGVKLPTMTDTVDKLVEKGIVKRIRKEDDRRTVWVTIAPEIKKMATKIIKQHDEHLEKIMSVLSEKEKEQAVKIITKIINSLKEGVK